MRRTCNKFGCDAPATVRVVPLYGRSTLRCAPHGEETLKVWSFFDNRQSDGSRLELLDPPRGQQQ